MHRLKFLLLASTTYYGALAQTPPELAKKRILETYRNLPQRFEANAGQLDRRVRFVSRRSGSSLFLTASGAVLALDRAGSKPAVLRMDWLGANPQTSISGLEKWKSSSNYLIGNRPELWHTGVPSYERVRYTDLYPGVDLVYYGNEGQLEYDLILAPGANLEPVRMKLSGARGIKRNDAGDVRVRLDNKDILLHRPFVYQVVNEQRQQVNGRYVLKGKNEIGFEVGPHDPALPLVIDPQVMYSSYLGGSANDSGQKVALDSQGNAFIVGTTASIDFPTASSYQAAIGGTNNVFIAKLNPNAAGANSLVYSTYLGGTGDSIGRGIAIGGLNEIIVAGDTVSLNFPVTTGAYQTSCNLQAGVCSSDVFVTKLDATGKSLLYSTYLGGTGSEFGFAVTTNPAGRIFVTGPTGSSDFPVTAGAAQTSFAGGGTKLGDVFIAELNPAGTGSSDLVYSTYLGGSGSDVSWGIAADSTGAIYVTGSTTSGNFPTTAGASQRTYSGGGSLALGDAFVTKLNPAGQGASDIVYSTYLGGSSDDRGESIALDASNRIYISGFTESANFPITAATAFQTSFGGGTCNGAPCADAVIAIIDPSLSGAASLAYSTYFGGSSFDLGHAIALDSSGFVYVAGETGSTDFPLVNPIQNTCTGGCTPPPMTDAFLAKFDFTRPGTTSLLFSTYYGGSDVDTPWGIAVDSAGNAYLTGQVFSTNFPMLIPYQAVCNGCTSFNATPRSGDAFLLKVCTTNCPAAGVAPPGLTYSSQPVGSASTAKSVTLSNPGTGILTVADISITGANAGDFSQTNNCPSTLGPSAQCTISVTFTPAAGGTRNAVVTIQDNGPGTPQTATLSGTGVTASVGLSATSLTFGNQNTNTTSAAQLVNLTNNGPGALTISTIAITGTNAGDYGQTNNCPLSPSTLAVNASCTISVTFTPTAAGTRSTSLTITDSGSGSPQGVSLTGTGVAPVITPWPNGYSYQATFTVATGKVPSAQTNFPVLISGTFPEFRTTANGGRVSNTCTQVVGNNSLAVPCDLVFTSDAAGSSLLNWEFESYNSTTGALNVWVNVPTLASGTVIYGWYGNSSMASLQTVPSTTWNGIFLAVYHLKEDPSGAVPQMNDSTANANHCTSNGSMPASQQTPGEIGGSLSFNGGAYYLTCANPTSFGFERTDSWSMSAWSKPISNNSGTILSKEQDASIALQGWELYWRIGSANPTVAVELANSNTNRFATHTASEFAASSFHHLAATYNGSGVAAGVTIYVDGATQTTSNITDALGSNSILTSALPEVSARGGAFSHEIATEDEVRVYAKGVVLSPAWITAEYNNQSSPTSFFSVNTGLTNSSSIPVVTFSSPSLTFASQTTNITSAAQLVNLTNNGPGALTISTIAITGTNAGDYGQTNNCPLSPSTLAVNASCTISVTFTPTEAGTRSASLTITGNGSGSPQGVSLTGTGVAPMPTVALSTVSLTFASQTTNTTSAAQLVNLTNNGPGALTISTIAITGTNAGDYGQTNNCPLSPSTLAVNASCTISVTFTPTAAGTRSASLTITDNGSGSPQGVSLTGTGVAPMPTVALSTVSLTFASQTTNTTSAAQLVNLTNNGPGALTISTIAITGTNAGDYGQTNNCPLSPSTLAVNASCTISVTFTPTAAGTRSTSLTITDSGSGSPQGVSLTGTGVAPVITPWPNGYSYQATFTVATGKVPSAQTNFPVLISGTFPEFRTTANGGRVSNTCTQVVGNNSLAVPCDLVFTSDAAGSSLLNWEFESYNSTTGALNVWVNVPTLASGTVIYGWYGNSSMASLQTVPSTTWNGIFLAVYHLKEDPSGAVPQMNDSTANANHCTSNGSMPASQQTPGEIGGSLSFNGGAYYLTCANPTSFGFERTDSWSMSAWSKPISNNSGTILSKEQDASIALQGWELYWRIGSANPTVAVELANSNTNRFATHTASEFAASSFHHLAATYNGSGVAAGVTIYVDGATQTTSNITDALGSNSILTSALPEVSARGGAFSHEIATEDEVRVYAKGVVLSPAWITAEYNNQSSPTSFFSVNTGLTNSSSIPVVTLSSPSLTFASQTTNITSAAQLVNLTNNGPGALTISTIAITGTNAGDYGQTNNCPLSPSTLAVNASCTISVTFTPTAAGTRSASLTITGNGSGSPQGVSLTGTGVAPMPTVALSTVSLTFASQTTNTTSAAQLVNLTNNGPGALTISTIAITGTNAGDYGQTNNCPLSPSTLAVNASCTISVTFTPTEAGTRSASLTITGNGSGSPQGVSLTGTGVAPMPTVALSTVSLTFASQTTNTTSAAQLVNLTNNGPGALTISTIAITGTNAGDYGQTNNCPLSPSTLAVNASCTISVTFTPTAAGTRSTSLTITDSGSGSPQGVSLTGTGVAPVITPWPNGYSYQATFTVATGKVPSAQTNFPVLISGTFPEFRTTANGGRVSNTCTQVVGNNSLAVPCDLVFTSDAAGSSLLNWEFESYNSTTGALNVWVNVPTLASGTVIYGWYGNSSMASLQTVPSTTWNGIFLAVYHLKEDPSGAVPQMNDSTANANHCTSNGSMPASQQTPGEIGGSLSFNGGAYYLTCANPTSFGFERTDSWSMSAWSKPISNNSGTILSKEQDASIALQGWELYWRIGSANPTVAVELANSNTNRFATHTASEFAASSFHHLAATYNGSGVAAGVTIYVDGATQTTSNITDALGSNSILTSALPEVSARGGAFSHEIATEDEVRVYAKGVVLSPAWITAEYNNQSNPATFFSVSTGLTNR